MGLRDWWESTAQPSQPLRVKATRPAPRVTSKAASRHDVIQMRQTQGALLSELRAERRNHPGQFQISDQMQQHVKSISYSDYVQDFINNTGFYEGDHYSKQQVEAAYRTSVYLFAALRRVANLFSEVRVVAEEKDDHGIWKRLPDENYLNMIFSQAGAKFMFDAFMYYAMYGKVLIYKRKTRKAMSAYRQGQMITNYLDGGISGIHIIPNVKWDDVQDNNRSEVTAFRINEPDENYIGTGERDRDEFVYFHDFDFRNPADAVSMVSLALNNAITNAAIARWASHYFMSGAMPLLLVSMQDDPALVSETDLLKYKSAVERMWQGMWGKFNLRAFFTDRKLDVQQAGIKAEEVQAPELNQDALNAITAVFQIAPDLIVPPPGGSDNARHKFLIMDAYNTAVLPLAKQLATQLNKDFGFDEKSPLRLVIAEEDIRALEAERADNADTELQIFDAGVQTFGEAQERLKIKRPVEELRNWIQINGKFQSVERLLRDDRSPDDRVISYAAQSFVDNIVTLGEVRKLLYDLETPDEIDGFYWQVVPAAGATAPIGIHPTGSGDPNPPTSPTQPPGGDSSGDTPPPGGTGPKPKPSPAPAPHGSPGDTITPAPAKPAAPGTPPTPPGSAKPSPGTSAKPTPPKKPAPGKKDEALVIEQSANGAEPVIEDEDAIYQSDEVTPTAPPTPVISAQQTNGQPKQLEVLPPATAPITAGLPPDPAFVCLWLAGDPLLAPIVQQIQAALKDLPIEWNDPETWHITAVSVNDCTDAQLKSASALIPAQAPALHLRVIGLTTFDTPSGTVIVMDVEPDQQLSSLQNAVYLAFAGQGVSMSPFSAPDAYHPHITLGTLPQAEADIPSFTFSMVVEPQALKIMRGDYQTIDSRPSIANWRDGVPAEPLDDAYSFDPVQRETRERMYEDTLRQRAAIRSSLNSWHMTGQPGPGLREAVRTAVRQTIASCTPDTEKAWLSIMLACEKGQLDEQADLEDHPIQIPSRAAQPTANQELSAWESYELRGKAADRPFETNLVPSALAAEVRAELKTATSRKAVRAAFTKARTTLTAQQRPPDTTEAVLAEWADRIGQNPELKGLLDAS